MAIRNMRIFILFVAFMLPSIALALTEAECEDVYIDSMGLAWVQEGGELFSGILACDDRKIPYLNGYKDGVETIIKNRLEGTP